MTSPEQESVPTSGYQAAVVLVNYHSERYLASCLEALAGQSLRPHRVIVVDNGSEGDRFAEALRRYPQAESIRMPQNVGFAAANNRAVQSVDDCEWVVLLNVDAIPRPDWFSGLIEAARRHPECAFFGSRLLMAGDRDLVDGTGDVYHCSGRTWRRDHGAPLAGAHLTTDGTIAPCAAAAMYRRDAWDAAGGLDESFFCYLEDVDLGLRLHLLNYEYRFVPESVVYHFGSAVTGRASPFYVFHGHRNIVWTYVKNMPGFLFWKYLPQHLLLNLLSIVWFSLRGRGGSVLRAKWSAVRGLPRAWRQRQTVQRGRRIAPRDFESKLARGLGRLLRGA